ncbi:phosphoglycerate kinase [Candidatus Falkowbacteria bacterium CG10_big_fil_rev_8_21_14_0_10_44_15]|uniref:Phosphoglycerate kinase n=1 Tax=Candidatus Falkowbacteria bacterium CG10_big_fil_rev_8_21_14_0_10_44_15 TaxID=1974569 RepID=A0A2H0V1E6_9BACT|nr:MAG: phosphoglycerate kinase [Candidatus Falkowbacteria bacterium CG10_big_fil_rev_8_21_14_0_10_44_15]
MTIKSIKTVKDLAGERVLVRCDFNVAVEKNKIIDDFKIVQSLPTIRYLISQGAKVILLTHFGRPDGKKIKKFKLQVIKIRLEKLLGKRVTYVEDCIGAMAKSAVARMKNGQVVLLENVRFYKEEEANDRRFAKVLASLADVYVNDAFAVSHRRHASVAAIKKYLPAYAGLLLAKEVLNLNKALRPAPPLVVIIGGAKLETKVPVIKNLRKKAKVVLIGGMIAYDFLAAKKWSSGRYRVAPASRRLAKKLSYQNVILPVDFVASDKSNGQGRIKVVAAADLPANMWQLDIGPETIRLYARYLKEAKTIIWNGPMGMFENEHFKTGTLAVARLVAAVSSGKAFGVVGGGETVAALKQTKMMEHVDWASTSGGAMLEYLAGKRLPGLKKIIK